MNKNEFHIKSRSAGKRNRNGKNIYSDGSSVAGVKAIVNTVSNNGFTQAGTTPPSSQIKEYRKETEFPETGSPEVLYISTESGKTYRWQVTRYVCIAGYEGGYGIEVTEDGKINSKHIYISDEEICNICKL